MCLGFVFFLWFVNLGELVVYGIDWDLSWNLELKLVKFSLD